jgi:hypothetical protein
MPAVNVVMSGSSRYGVRVRFRPVKEYDWAAGADDNPWKPEPPLPHEFEEFSREGGGAVGFSTDDPRSSLGWASVSLRLTQDATGAVDTIRLRVAADWLRDRGWTVEGGDAWCRAALAGEPVG